MLWRHLDLLMVTFVALSGMIVIGAYKPVVLVHGILSGAESMMTLQDEIELVKIRKLIVSDP